MKRTAYIIIAFVSILALSVVNTGARGLGEKEKEGEKAGAHVGGKGSSGGGGISHIAPSANRPSLNKPHSSGQFSKPTGGGYSKPTIKGQKSTFKPESLGTRTNVKPVGKKPLPQVKQPLTGQVGKGKPTHGQVQEFLKLPKTNAGQIKSGLGKIGAAAVGGAAGAMALDHFLNKGKLGDPGHPGVGHMPGPGGHPGQQVNPQKAQHIRENYSQHYHNMFNKNWYANHPNLNNFYWHSHIWPYHPWNYWWRPAAWAALSSWVVWTSGPPLYYDYGNNFYYENDFVYLNGRRLCTAGEYYGQAFQIVTKTPEVKDDAAQWMPLGVFALSQGDSGASNMVVQLAVNKDGVIQGTYYNTDNDMTKPIKGMVDKQSQRAVWTFADDSNNAVIMETGIYNLTQDQTDVLVHFGKDRTEQWLLVRLKEPPTEE